MTTTLDDAIKRLATCRDLQPDHLTVSVAGDIVDALVAGMAGCAAECSRRRVLRGTSVLTTAMRCPTCEGTGVIADLR